MKIMNTEKINLENENPALSKGDVSGSLPNEEQIYCWWVHFQWALAAPEEYFEGLEDGFKGSIKWMIENGYVELTEKGKQYIPNYKQ